MVNIGDTRKGLGSSFVVADIPGLIPGASQGAGLGTRFLRHVERTRALLHLVSLSDDPEHDPLKDYLALRKELGSYSPEMLKRPEIVALTKADLTDVKDAFPVLREAFARIDVKLRLISACHPRRGRRLTLGALGEKLQGAT